MESRQGELMREGERKRERENKEEIGRVARGAWRVCVAARLFCKLLLCGCVAVPNSITFPNSRL